MKKEMIAISKESASHKFIEVNLYFSSEVSDHDTDTDGPFYLIGQ